MTHALILRTCSPDGASHGGFRWPESGHVEAPDWDPEPVCGGGLHGLLWGEGGGGLLSRDPAAVWIVARVDVAEIVDLRGKVKFPRADVVYYGERLGATAYIQANGGAGRAIVGAVVTAGYSGHATAGDYGHAVAGYYGHATAGRNGHATAGYYGHATAGDYGHAVAGDYGHATAGRNGHATAGDYGHATAGDSGHATAGYYGHATAGRNGHATAGYSGHATAGAYGIISIAYWGGGRRRMRVGYIGEDGLRPGTPYRLDGGENFVEVEA